MSTTRYTKNRTKIVFGQDMKECPNCGSYHFKFQTPIKMETPIEATDSPKQMVKKWAKEMLKEDVYMEGPVFIMCFDCGHKGPSVDCSGRTLYDVGKDAKLSSDVKMLWNNQ